MTSHWQGFPPRIPKDQNGHRPSPITITCRKAFVSVSRIWRILIAFYLGASFACIGAEDAKLTKITEVLAKQKTTHKGRPRQTEVLTEDVANLTPDKRSRYGGWMDRKGKGTGFFRVERDPDGRWWLIDPDGYSFISVGVNAVRPNGTKRGLALWRERYPSNAKWADDTATLLRTNAFNSLGAWSYTQLVGTEDRLLPYTKILNFMAKYAQSTRQSSQGIGHRDYPDDLIPIFDSGFEAFCQKEAKELQTSKSDPQLIGVFSDNEMPFPEDTLDRYLRRPLNDPGHMAALKWLKSQGKAKESIDDEVRARFLGFAAERYFRICREAIKANSPNHLYLGCRFHEKVLWREPVFRSASKHVDVLSINWYGQWTPDQKTMDDWVAWTGRPFLISEFFAKGMDSGLPNTSGAGWVVQTQEDRGAFYQNFTLPLLRHPGCVGWHWFRYMDNDPDDTPADPTNADANKGIVNGDFKPWTTLLGAMNALNQRTYQLRVQPVERSR